MYLKQVQTPKKGGSCIHPSMQQDPAGATCEPSSQNTSFISWVVRHRSVECPTVARWKPCPKAPVRFRHEVRSYLTKGILRTYFYNATPSPCLSISFVSPLSWSFLCSQLAVETPRRSDHPAAFGFWPSHGTHRITNILRNRLIGHQKKALEEREGKRLKRVSLGKRREQENLLVF